MNEMTADEIAKLRILWKILYKGHKFLNGKIPKGAEGRDLAFEKLCLIAGDIKSCISRDRRIYTKIRIGRFGRSPLT